MGSYGSTRWGAHAKKRTTAECIVLDVNRILKRAIGTENMTRASRRSGLIDASFYFAFVNVDGNSPVLFLEAIHPPPADQTITFLSTPNTYGGLRWYWCCLGCARRVGKLYLPPGGKVFACRHCHALTYTSAQTAHRYDRRNDEIGWMGQSLALLHKMERAYARYSRYQRSCKGKFAAMVEYLRLAEQVRLRLSPTES